MCTPRLQAALSRPVQHHERPGLDPRPAPADRGVEDADAAGAEHPRRSDDYPELVLGDEIQTGLVAQQVGKVLPELVVEDEDGFLRVRYNQLPLLLLQALKEQQEQTQRLERRVRELAAQLAELEPGKPSA